MSRRVFDLETDGLLDVVSKLHCGVTVDADTGEQWLHDPESSLTLNEYLEDLRASDLLIGHNIVGYDLPALKKLGHQIEGPALYDTLLMAQLFFPDINRIDSVLLQRKQLPGKLFGRHSLEAYGYRLKCMKDTFGHTTDWQMWTPEMSTYCEQDVRVNVELFKRLQKMHYKGCEEAIELEHSVAQIIHLQEQNGVCFNVEKANALILRLHDDLKVLEDQLTVMTPDLLVVPEPRTFIPKADNKRFGYTKGAAMTKIKVIPFEVSKARHAMWLIRKRYGWLPTESSETVTAPKWLGLPEGAMLPKLDENVYKDIKTPETELITKILLIKKRLSQLQGGKQALIKKVTDEGRIHGRVRTLGTRTRRMSHSGPNLGQIPASYSPYGKSFRALFEPRPGWKMVGCDADGLEARCLAHWLHKYDRGAYGVLIETGDKKAGTDNHTMNSKVLTATRDTAKTFLYAWLYGAGKLKLGKTLLEDVTKNPQSIYKGHDASPAALKRLGTKMAKKFVANIPGLEALISWVKDQSDAYGYVVTIDGSHIHSPSSHSALNTLLQSTGAVIMKRALVLAHEELSETFGLHGSQWAWCLNVHDEFQVECEESIADAVGKVMAHSILRAGEFYDFNLPTPGDYDVGDSWKDTH